MSNSNSGTQPETAAEKAVADLAAAKFRDYQTRWAPRQAALADITRRMGAEGSFEREQLKAKGAADIGVNFNQAARQVVARDTAAGINRNSSAAKLKEAGMASDRASSTGISTSLADQAIDDSYIQGLTQLMQIGRGNEATAVKGMGEAARIQAGIAQEDATLSANARAGNLNAAGTIIGASGVGMARRRATGGNAGIPTAQDYDTLGVGLPTFKPAG